MIIAALCATALAGHAQANDDNPFSAEVSAGLEYSSKIAIDELDAVADSGDVAALLGVELGYELDLTSKTKFDVTYSFSQSLHEELEQFDLRSHFGVVNVSQDFGKVDAGLSYRYLDASLDGSGFMDYAQVAPYLTALIGTKMFVRAEYGQADKEFDVDTVRNADVESIGADWYFFLDGPRSYVLVGYRADEHDAVSPEHVYDQDNFKLHYVKRFDLFGSKGKFNIGLRLENRDYENVTASIGVPREDERRKLRMSLELPFGDHLGTEIRYELRDIESNLPAADRAEQVGSVEFFARF